MKIKKYSEVNYIATPDKTIKDIKRDFKILIVAMIMLLFIAVVSIIKLVDMAKQYIVVKQENKELTKIIEMKSSQITDLEENCKDLFIELQDIKFEN